MLIALIALIATTAFGFVAVIRENRRDNASTRASMIVETRTEIRASLAEHIIGCPMRHEQSGRILIHD